MMWSKTDSGKGMNWEAALSWVQARNAEKYFGHNDWRLPHAKELQSIVDYTRSPDTTASPAIHPLFSCTRITNEIGQADYPCYWAGTTHATALAGGAAVYVAFGRAAGWPTGMPGPGGGPGRGEPGRGVAGRRGPPPGGRVGAGPPAPNQSCAGSVEYHFTDVHGAGGGGAGGGRTGGGGDAAGRRQANQGNAARAAARNRDMWSITLGDAQYAWLKKTLETSRAPYKFVFAHHVMGTGRGAVEGADFHEWGGKDPRGAATFKEKRPDWELPIHQLMVKTGVTIFFQGHDHLFARQQKDGIIYQEVPNPADLTYTAFNREAYRSGDILPNTGHLLVTVAPDQVRVDYIRSYLAKDETPDRKHGEVAFSYTVKARAPGGK
jgi:hypothetical protein